jgi:FlaA1/EpsC-like NDP-sugar epimerase
MHQALVVFILIRILTFVIFRTYADFIRYTSTRDAIKVILSLALGSLLFVVVNTISLRFITHAYIIPLSIIIIEFFISTVLLVGLRILIKLAYFEIKNPSKAKSDVIIFGAGNSGLITKRSLDRDAGMKYKVVAFIDDDNAKCGMKLEGVPIYKTEKLAELLENQSVAHIIISIPSLSSYRKNEIANISLQYNTKVLVVPPVFNWINGELSFKQIKKIKIEDLLERDVIQLDNKKISSFLSEQVILVTGAAGSIGSEIVRQLVKYSPKYILCVDHSETGLYHLELDLISLKKAHICKLIVGDIKDEIKMRQIFEEHHPMICFHAAAYKHVPLMESQVSEAIKNNVLGTKLIADLSVEYLCQRFVMISTDKAVNPTSVMGASKRMAEIYIQSLSKKQEITKFITTRFGNVLGSNGSVIPLFRQQIENGGPVTVTHPEVTRFFMTIKEACQLVIEAAVMGNGGEIFIFDMGNSVKIVDLAKRMIQLSGLTLGKDIQIVYTGLRPGEKLYEELLNNMENTLPTYHDRILIATVREYEFNEVNQRMSSLRVFVLKHDENAIVKELKLIIPEYKSHNSIYEKFDVN